MENLWIVTDSRGISFDLEICTNISEYEIINLDND